MILTEFFDSNTHKCYPFSQVNELPTDLFVDAQFVTTPNIMKDSISINRIVVSEQIIQCYVRCIIDGASCDLGLLVNISTDVKPYTEHNFTIISDTYKAIIQGSITTGYFDTILRNSKSAEVIYELEDSGTIIPQRVIPVTEWCTGLIVNDKLYTGNVVLEVGEGLELSENNGCLSITARGLTTPTKDTMTDEEIIEEVIKRMGKAVKSINGLTGDITIGVGSYNNGRVDTQSQKTDANNLGVKVSGNSITIYNYIDNPNYDVNGGSNTIDMSAIGILLANANALNDRAGTLEQHNYALDNAVNLLGAQLAKVD